MKKKWWKSKTLWLNGLMVFGAAFGVDGAFGHVFSPEEVGATVGIGNILLRLVTSKGIVG